MSTGLKSSKVSVDGSDVKQKGVRKFDEIARSRYNPLYNLTFLGSSIGRAAGC